MITETIEWENDSVRLVALGGLERSPNFPAGLATRSQFRQLPRRKVERVVIHQTAGSRKDGIAAPKAIARFATAAPKYGKKNGRTRRVGGGRGWPGCPYPFVVPTIPDVQDGLLVVYRCWPDDWITFHTGPEWNSRATAVAFAGSFKSRHAPRWSQNAYDPDETALHAGQTLVTEYLLPRYGLTEEHVIGHFDAGKVTCPGDTLEGWVRALRGETAQNLDGCGQGEAEDRRSLETWEERQWALKELGFDLGPSGVDGIWGFWTRSAVEAFQEDAGLVVDGIWGKNTEAAVRRALATG